MGCVSIQRVSDMASTRERGLALMAPLVTAEVGTAQRVPAEFLRELQQPVLRDDPLVTAAMRTLITKKGGDGNRHYKSAHTPERFFKSVYLHGRNVASVLALHATEKIGCKEITVLMALPPATAPFTDQDFRDLDQALGVTTQPSVDRDVIKGDQRMAKKRWTSRIPDAPGASGGASADSPAAIPLSDLAALTSPDEGSSTATSSNGSPQFAAAEGEDGVVEPNSSPPDVTIPMGASLNPIVSVMPMAGLNELPDDDEPLTEAEVSAIFSHFQEPSYQE